MPVQVRQGSPHRVTQKREKPLPGREAAFLGWRSRGGGLPDLRSAGQGRGELKPAGEIGDDDQRDRYADQPEKRALHGFVSRVRSGIRTPARHAGSMGARDFARFARTARPKGQMRPPERRFRPKPAVLRPVPDAPFWARHKPGWAFLRREIRIMRQSLGRCSAMLRRKRHTPAHMELSTASTVQFR